MLRAQIKAQDGGADTNAQAPSTRLRQRLRGTVGGPDTCWKDQESIPMALRTWGPKEMASRGRMQWPWVTALPHGPAALAGHRRAQQTRSQDRHSQSPSRGLDGLPGQIPMLFPLCAGHSVAVAEGDGGAHFQTVMCVSSPHKQESLDRVSSVTQVTGHATDLPTLPADQRTAPHSPGFQNPWTKPS